MRDQGLCLSIGIMKFGDLSSRSLFLFGLFALAGFCVPITAFAQIEGAPAVPPGTLGTPPVMNQPVVINPSEKVEMERLRIAQESANLAREDALYREQLLKLQQKLARASISALPVDQIPAGFLNDFRSFLSANAGDVDRSAEYYQLLTDTLNDLVPNNPYANASAPAAAAGQVVGQPNVERAQEKLSRLFTFPEDDSISRNIMAQVAAVRGAVFDSDKRRNQLLVEYQALEKRKKNLSWNIAVASEPNKLSGSPSIGAKSVPMYKEELRQVEERLAEIKEESQGLAPALQRATRELQFQQFIIELAFQQRYIHSLIASGFYRFYSQNMTVSPEAYPKQENKSPAASKAPASGGAERLVPRFNNIPALETFLLNRIRDVAKDREAIENMLKSDQLSSAENLVRELVLTAKYQPELHTIHYDDRQRLLSFSDLIRRLSDSLGARDYDEILKVADEIEKISADPGMADVKAFAEEHPRKALQWVRQAKVAMQLGDTQSMQSLIKAANDRAPLDASVEEAVRNLEREVMEGGELKSDLMRLVEAGNYREIYRRRSDFARFSASDADPDLATRLDEMLKKEATIQEALKKCDEFEARASFPDMWMVLSEIPTDLAIDERIGNRMEATERRCEDFALAYQKAHEQDKEGNESIALAWYLTALAQAPASTAKLRPRIEELARAFAAE